MRQISLTTRCSEGLDAIKTILILPLEIAINRLLILRETTSGYDFAIFAPRFRRLLGWTAVLWALITLPPYLPGLIAPSEDADSIATIATAIVVVVLLLRLAILFPAIAVDAPGASLNHVLADTKARSWLILKSFFIVLLPVLAGLLAVGLISELDDLPNWWSAARIAFDSPLELLATVLAAATASRLYGWIGHQVKGVPI